MKWSQTLIPTLREEPQEAEIESHKLMLRAGLIRRLTGGLYTFLPLGLKALQKVERIVREEMDAAGAQEILMPALQPREIWDKTDRYDSMSDVMFRSLDHQNREFVLGPTHEEVVTLLMAGELRSYRQLPLNLYQVQTKFRDEIRPRFGLMRSKEFIMKDAYSFDCDWDGAEESYQKMYNAYSRIFQRCGLETKVVEAETGAMGGKSSHEFMVLAESGEDGIVECSSCSYAANLERAERVPRSAPPETDENPSQPSPVQTPGMTTIDGVSNFLNCPVERLVKTLIYVIDGKPVAILTSGEREVNEHKIARHFKTDQVALADNETIEKSTGAPVGYAGPVNIQIPVYADIDLQGRKNTVTGANKADLHLTAVDLERDADIREYADFGLAAEGDLCPRCSAPMKERRGIEIGHVFKLGTKYSEKLQACFLDESGKKQPAVMGCYGIGVTRTLQAVIEQRHDKKGIIWPMSIAPAQVAIVPLSSSHQRTMDVAHELCQNLESAGIDIIIDDRDERPGVKFNDTELIGFPLRVVVSERSLAKQSLELFIRSTGKSELIPVHNASAQIVDYCRNS